MSKCAAAQRAARLRAAGFAGPFALDHVAAGLVIDQFGQALALTLPTFTDPRDRTWAAREIVAALNAHFDFEAAADSSPTIERRTDRRAAA